MNVLDLVIALVALAAVLGGFRRGFVARASSWVGIALGLYLGARLVPLLADDGALNDLINTLNHPRYPQFEIIRRWERTCGTPIRRTRPDR